MSRRNLSWLLAVPALALFGLVVTATAPPPDKDYELVRTVVDVLAQVDKSYVRELSPKDKKKLVEDMINGGLEKLDKHSQYLNEDDNSDFTTQSEGQFGGIGIVVVRDPQSGVMQVESPIPGTPAYDAGIVAGDYVFKVDGKPLDGLKVEDARSLIKGKAGTPVTLTIQHQGASQPEDVQLVRAVIAIHPVKGFARDPADPAKWNWFAEPSHKIAIVRLTAFSEKSDKEVRDAVLEAQAAGAEALILDMRDNPGGLLPQAIAVADLFLTEGAIVSTGSNRNGADSKVPRRTFSAKADGTVMEPAVRHPMAVLVNRYSASAAEIVAAALQDHRRATVIGERSYGKGSVQHVFDLPGKASLKLTTEVWMTPQGKNIHRWPDSKEEDQWGVRPDAGFEVKLSDAQRREYFQSFRELDMVRGRPGTPPAKVDPAKGPKPAYVDPVIQKAVEHLKGQLAAVPPAAGKPA